MAVLKEKIQSNAIDMERLDTSRGQELLCEAGKVKKTIEDEKMTDLNGSSVLLYIEVVEGR